MYEGGVCIGSFCMYTRFFVVSIHCDVFPVCLCIRRCVRLRALIYCRLPWSRVSCLFVMSNVLIRIAYGSLHVLVCCP